MPKFRVYGIVTGTKYLGTFEAETAEQAEEMASECDENSITICNQCSDGFELDDHACHDFSVEEEESNTHTP